MRTSRAGSGGFTLVELTVVIVMMAVLATMIVPRVSGSARSARLREDAARMLTAARYARNYAITHRCVCRLVLDPTDGQYVLEYEPQPEEQPGQFAPLTGAMGKARRLEEGVGFGGVRIEPSRGRAGRDNAVSFSPTGQSDAAVVELTDGRRTISLVLIGSSGRAALVDGTVRRPPDDRRDLDA